MTLIMIMVVIFILILIIMMIMALVKIIKMMILIFDDKMREEFPMAVCFDGRVFVTAALLI